MDPTVTLKFLLDALATEDRTQAIASMEDLISWIDRDGALPELTKGATRYIGKNAKTVTYEVTLR